MKHGQHIPIPEVLVVYPCSEDVGGMFLFRKYWQRISDMNVLVVWPHSCSAEGISLFRGYKTT